MTHEDIERTILRAIKRLNYDIQNQSELTGGFAKCQCGHYYNVWNPHASSDGEDLDTCALCAIVDLAEVYGGSELKNEQVH